MTTLWQITLFGTLRIQKPDGETLSLRGKKAGVLLAYLALYPDKTHFRGDLAERLWSPTDVVDCRTRLRQELTNLRDLLGENKEAKDGLLVTTRDTIGLRPGAFVTDVGIFRQNLALAEASSDAAERERLLAEAVKLYERDLLTDYGEDWVEAERTNLMNLFEKALQELALVQQARGDFPGAEASLKRLVAHNRFLEESHLALMHLYAEMGQPSLVRRQYEALEKAIWQEHSEKPSEATKKRAETLILEAIQRKEKREQGEIKATVPKPASPRQVPPNPLPREEGKPVSQPGKSLDTISPAFPSFWVTGTVLLACSVLLAGLLLPKKFIKPDVPVSVLPATPLSPRESGKTPSENIKPHGAVAPQGAAKDITASKHPVVTHRQRSSTAEENGKGTKISKKAPRIVPTHIAPQKLEWTYALSDLQNLAGGCPKAMVKTPEGIVMTCKTGMAEEEGDIVTVALSSDRRLLWQDRYSGEGHRCDRPLSVLSVPEDGSVFVGGESQIAEKPGEAGGWRLTVLKYSREGTRLWVRQSRMETKNFDGKVQVASDGQGGCYIGGTALEMGVPYIVVLHYDNRGELLWTYPYRGISKFGSLVSNGKVQGGVYVAGTLCLQDAGNEIKDVVIFACESHRITRWQATIPGARHGGNLNVELLLDGDSLYVGGTMWANEMGNGIPGPKMFLSRRDISSGKDIGTKSEGSSGEGLSFARMVEMDNYMILFSTPSSLPESRGQVTAEVYDKTGAFTKELKLGSPPRRTFRTASSNVWMDGRKGHLRSGADAFMLAGIEGDLHCQYVWCVQPTEKDMHCTITLQTCVNGKEEHDDALYVAAASNLPGMKPTYAIHKFRLQHLERPIVKPQNHAGNTYLP